MLSVLKEVVEPQVVVRHRESKVQLTEANPDARLREVNIHLTSWLREGGGHLRNALIVSGDNEEDDSLNRFTFFVDPSKEHVTKKCDYIIFHATNDVVRVILCELKSSEQGVGEEARCHNQYRFSQIFAEYLLNIAKEYAQVRGIDIEQENISFHKLAFVTTPNVSLSLPTGMPPSEASGINVRYSEQKQLNVVFLSPDSNASASLNWRELMEKLS